MTPMQKAAEALRLAREWNDYWRAQNEPKLVAFTDTVIAALIEAELSRVPEDGEALAQLLEVTFASTPMGAEIIGRAAAALRSLSSAEDGAAEVVTERDSWKRWWELRAHMLDKAEAEVSRLREALREIARQHVQGEFDDEEMEHGDIPGAYDAIIGIARAALGANPPAREGK